MKYYNAVRTADPSKLVNWVCWGHPFLQTMVVKAIDASPGDGETFDLLKERNTFASYPVGRALPQEPGYVFLAQLEPESAPPGYKLIDCTFGPKFFAERWDFYRPKTALVIPTPVVPTCDDPAALDQWALTLSLALPPDADHVSASLVDRVTTAKQPFRHIRTDVGAPITWKILLNLYEQMAKPAEDRKFPYNQPNMTTKLGSIRRALLAMEKGAPSYLIHHLLQSDCKTLKGVCS